MAGNTYGQAVIVPKKNNSGGSVAAGDVVVEDTTADNAFTTTTSANVTKGVWVAQETIASGSTGRVLVEGHATLVNVNASVTRGHYGATYTVVKQATDAGGSRTAGTFCLFTTGGTTPEADIYPVDLASASAGSLLGYHQNNAAHTYTTTSSTFADVDATNMAVTFTAPASGNVLVRLTAYSDLAATNSAFGRWGLREGSTDLGVGGSVARGVSPSQTFNGICSIAIVVTGLSAGSHTYKWSWANSDNSCSFRILSDVGGATQPPATMEVWAL